MVEPTCAKATTTASPTTSTRRTTRKASARRPRAASSGIGLSVTEVPRGLRVGDRLRRHARRARRGSAPGDMITAVDGKSIAGQNRRTGLDSARSSGPSRDTGRADRRPADGSAPRQLDADPASESRSRPSGPTIAQGRRRQGRLRALSAFSHRRPRGAARTRSNASTAGRRGPRARPARQRRRPARREAVLVSSIFVEDGDVVSTPGAPSSTRSLRRLSATRFPSARSVVLINGDTASASEILTAALKQAGLATVVGDAAPSARARSRRSIQLTTAAPWT